MTAGTLPTGLTLDGAGLLSGTPTQAGTFNFSVTATDSSTGTGAPFSITRNYSVTIYDVVQVTNASPLPNAAVGTAYSQQMTATGGNGPAYTFTLSFGSLPAGLTLTNQGLLSGTPTQGGDFFFSISATDPGGVTRGKNFQLAVTAPTITIQPLTLNAGTVAASYNQALAAAGGSFNFTITATDSSTGTGAPYSGSRAYALTINAATLAMTPASGALPAATQNTAYCQQLTASNGTAPYTYAVFSGALPTGVTLDPSTGLISGTPTAFGAFSFAIRSTDSSTGSGPYTVTNSYTLNVAQALPTVTAVAPNNGTTAGGTAVTITGTNFQNASAVTFGGTAATGITVVNATTITATTPAHAAGAVNVVVTTPGGAGTLPNGYTYVAPGATRFVVNSGGDDGSFGFTSATPGLNFTITTSGGTGTGPTVTLQPGNYSLAFTTPDGFGIASATCAPSTSTVNTSAKTAALVVASNVTTICTIEALPSRRATVEAIGAALDAQSRLILANAPTLSRRIDRLSGGGASGGSASAFGKTFASNLPFSADIGADTARFSMSLSGLRKAGNADHRFDPANDNGVPASLAASVAPASGLAATAAADAASSMSNRSGPRFDIWVEGLIARFDAAANSDGDFAIVHAGADYLVTPNLLVGVGIQGDWLNMDTSTGTLDSSGYLAGPYLTARLADHLYIDARAAWGSATLDVSPFGTYTDQVDSVRELYSAALIGEFSFGGDLTVRPEARVSWYKETTEAYIDSLSVAIPSVEIKTGEVTLGPDFVWALTRENGGVFSPHIGFDLVWTFQQNNTATAFTSAPGLDDTGIRGRVEGGFSYLNPQGVEVGASLFYDGIGGGDYSAYGATAKIAFGF
jgi:hypothetical protein